MNQAADERKFVKTADPVYVQDQLVVATPHVQRVIEKIPGLGMGVTVAVDDENAVERDPRLDLSLLTLTFEGGAPADGFDVGLLITRLRKAFEDENQGWAPTIGKNRFVDDQVIGGGSMSYGGFGDPESLTDRPGDVRERANWASPRPAIGAGVVVGLIDTPISGRSVPLTGTWTGGVQDILSDEGGQVEDGFTGVRWAAVRGHATFVAGLILSIAPGARLVVRGELAPRGRTDSWTVAKAIAELGQSDIDVLNLSFTCLTADGKAPLALATAISKVNPKTVIVAAAGNHASVDHLVLPVVIDGVKFGAQDDVAAGIKDIRKCAAFPAALDGVVAVGAQSPGGTGRAEYTPAAPWVDLLAPGDAASTFLQERNYDGFARWAGTSFAAARVTGAIAAGTVPGEKSARKAFEELTMGSVVQDAEAPKVVAPVRAWLAADPAGPADPPVTPDLPS